MLSEVSNVVFYLGTHLDGWLNHVGVPLFVSHRRLVRRKTLPKARTGWALDSGGFSELSLYGGWRTTPEECAEHGEPCDGTIGSCHLRDLWAMRERAASSAAMAS